MEKVLLGIGRVAGVAGAALSVLAGAARASGEFYLGGVQLATLLQAGMAAMILGCLCLLAVLTSASKPRQ